jgi:uncharacterized 2Fe-2S/4Fe-4S cluster protein (DUF4445 family)
MMDGKESFEIEFQPIGKRLIVTAGATIAPRNAGIELASACGGGNCGLCQIIIMEGRVTLLP